MSCDCTDKQTFEKMLDKALYAEKMTGKTYVVYIRNVNNKEHFFLRTWEEFEDLNESMDYYLSDGTKRKYTSKKKILKKEEKAKDSFSDEIIDKK